MSENMSREEATIEAVARALAEADPGYYYGEIDGKWRDETVHWDTRLDREVEAGDGGFVPGRDYFRKQASAALTAMQPLIDVARAEGYESGMSVDADLAYKAGFTAGQAQSKVDIQRLKDAVMIIGSLPYSFDVRHPAHPHPLGLQSLYEMGVGDLFEDDARRLNRIVKADLERVAEAQEEE